MRSEATQILSAISAGDRSDVDRLMEITYEDLKRLATAYLAGATPSNTLQPTVLVHEAFMKLVNQQDTDWRGRSHFFAVGATAMRQILVDHARKNMAVRRGAQRTRVALDERLAVSPQRAEDVLELDEALDKLSKINGRRAKIVEMRFFAGMTLEEIALAMDISVSTVKRQWAATSSWLRSELQSGSAL